MKYPTRQARNIESSLTISTKLRPSSHFVHLSKHVLRSDRNESTHASEMGIRGRQRTGIVLDAMDQHTPHKAAGVKHDDTIGCTASHHHSCHGQWLTAVVVQGQDMAAHQQYISKVLGGAPVSIATAWAPSSP